VPFHAAMANVVAFHAHPDDEVLLTSGTLAGAVAVGHRVVIVVAADGHVTAVSDAAPSRLGELRASAAVLGVHRVEHLGYADSGHGAILYPDPPDRRRFVPTDTEEAAGRLAAGSAPLHAAARERVTAIRSLTVARGFASIAGGATSLLPVWGPGPLRPGGRHPADLARNPDLISSTLLSGGSSADAPSTPLPMTAPATR
jgi:hypothetical protein